MGTRADFYVGRGPTAEWIGSIAWDGYPNGIPDEIRQMTDEGAYRTAVAKMLSERDDGTTTDMGWPWPWNDSGTTDYAYALDERAVHVSPFGASWRPATDDEESEDEDDGPAAIFPDMTERKKVTFGKRSGVIIIGG